MLCFQLEKSLAAACSQADAASSLYKQQLSELKSSLSMEKAERNKEAANNQVILRYFKKKCLLEIYTYHSLFLFKQRTTKDNC